MWTSLNLKITVFWDVAPCSLLQVYRRFGGAYCLPPFRSFSSPFLVVFFRLPYFSTFERSSLYLYNSLSVCLLPFSVCFPYVSFFSECYEIKSSKPSSAGDGAFMLNVLAMLARLTLKKTKNKKSNFRGSVVLHVLEHSRADQIKCIVSQLQPAGSSIRA
jgi:hypothetical protein